MTEELHLREVYSRSARWSLRCKNTYYPTENMWQVQLTGKPLALFFFSREFKRFLILLKNTVGDEKLDVILKKHECEELPWFNHIHQLSPRHLFTHCLTMGWQRESRVKVRKILGWDKKSLIGKAKAAHTSKEKI